MTIRSAKKYIAVLVLIALSGWAAAQDLSSKDRPATGLPTGQGFNVHVMGTDQDWDAIKAAGAKFIRKDFAWQGIERRKGEYDFGAYDHMVESLEAKGIRPLFILDYGNRLYTNAETTDEGREAFAKWAAASAGHFKGRNIIWEIWNEPNVGFWKGKGGLNSTEFADEYVTLVKKTVPAMRAADPDCCILAGSVSCLWRDSFRWMDEAFKEGLLQTGISALSVHPYGFSRPEMAIDSSQPGSRKDEGYGLLREKMAKAGAPKDFQVLNTEVGFPAEKKVTVEQQAMLVVRQYLVDQMCDIRTTTFYNWDENDAAKFKFRGRDAEPNLAYSAVKNMNAELAGYHFVDRLKVGSNVDYVIAFENGSKGRKIIAWTVPPGRDDAQDKAASHDLSIPIGSAGGPVAIRDLYGKTVEAKATEGSVILSLTASPQYVEVSGKAAVAPSAKP